MNYTSHTRQYGQGHFAGVDQYIPTDTDVLYAESGCKSYRNWAWYAVSWPCKTVCSIWPQTRSRISAVWSIIIFMLITVGKTWYQKEFGFFTDNVSLLIIRFVTSWGNIIGLRVEWSLHNWGSVLRLCYSHLCCHSDMFWPWHGMSLFSPCTTDPPVGPLHPKWRTGGCNECPTCRHSML